MSRLTVSMKSRAACTLSTFSVSAWPRCWNMLAERNTTANTMNMTTIVTISSTSENPCWPARRANVVIAEVFILFSHSNNGAHVDRVDNPQSHGLLNHRASRNHDHLGAVRRRSPDHIPAHFIRYRRVIRRAAGHVAHRVVCRDARIVLRPINRALIGQLGTVAAVRTAASGADDGGGHIDAPAISRSRTVLDGIGQDAGVVRS